MAATRNKKPSCSVVIPVHNSSLSLATLFEKLDKVFKSLRLSYEIVAVEDGSRDHSWHVLKTLLRAGKYPLRALRLSRNFGQHNALLCGMKYCQGRYIITMDDDLQHPPEEIPALLKEIHKGYDLVYGVYFKRKHGWIRNLMSWLSKGLLRLAIPELNPNFTSFRAIQARCVKNILNLNMPFTFIDGALAWVTGNVGTVRVRNDARAAGKSGYNLFSLLGYTLDILTTFSSLPLRIASVSGFIIASLGFIYGFYLIVRNLVLADATSAYTPLMAGKLFLSGIILIAVGINGEYLGRVNHKTTGRPRFVESENLCRRTRGKAGGG
jgi:undecaprenyl-phosphate 4-deoxy-4-formamido-L-arabinose transferase